MELYFVLEMTFLDYLRSPRLDRDAAFDAAVREGRLPTPDRCPYCGQAIAQTPSPPASERGVRERTVDEELQALARNGSA